MRQQTGEAAFDKELADETELAGGDDGSFDDELRLLHLERAHVPRRRSTILTPGSAPFLITFFRL